MSTRDGSPGSVLEENDGNFEENGVFFLHFGENMSRKWKFSKVCLFTFSGDVFFVHLFWILGIFLAVEFKMCDSKWWALSKYM